MELEIGNLETKVKTQLEQMDIMTEALSVTQTVVNEKQLKIESLEQEMAI
jgi:hypothetical protein